MHKDLFIKYLNNTCSADELAEIHEWFREKSNNVSDQQTIKKIWDEFDFSGNAPETSSLEGVLDKIHHEINLNESALLRKNISFKASAGKGMYRVLVTMTRVAAVLFLPLLLGIIYTYSTLNTKPGVSEIAGNRTVHSERNIPFIEILVPVGSILNTELPDGTKVWLNQGSKLKYPQKFTGNTRRIFMEGEGFFKVSHNPEIPFIVEVNRFEVVALGTEFNIRAYPQDNTIETSLVSGRVVVNSMSRKGDPSQKIFELLPMEHMVIDLTANTFTSKAEYLENFVSWKDGKLIFKEASLKEILRRLSNWNNTEFIVIDKDIENLTYTATFTDETLPQMLDLLSAAAPVRFRTTNREKLPDGTFSKTKIYVYQK